jgi:hypothetical protein
MEPQVKSSRGTDAISEDDGFSSTTSTVNENILPFEEISSLQI